MDPSSGVVFSSNALVIHTIYLYVSNCTQIRIKYDATPLLVASNDWQLTISRIEFKFCNLYNIWQDSHRHMGV